ncbi:MAG: molybdopterin-dependent oxidoreductase [Desulfopila sp.]
MTSHRSVCPYDCPDTCGLLVTVEHGRVSRVSGDPNHPVTRGLICAKMARYQDTVHSPHRLTTPLLRDGVKGEGAFTPISWDEAIERVCTHWQELIAAYGGECILPYSYAGTMGLIQRNSGHPFFHRLGASRLDRTICSPAKDAGWQMLMGNTPGMHLDKMGSSDLVILWGIDAAATSIHTMRDALLARRNGAKLWVIDTHQTPTAEAADEVFLVKPGMDGGLALAMMHVLVRDGHIDTGFVQENVVGINEFSRAVMERYSPRQVASRCGLSPEAIEKMAREYGAARAPFIRLGSGLTRYGNGAMTVRTICCLPALVGAWQHPGGGIFLGTSTGAAFPIEKVIRHDFSSRPTRLINMNQLGNALNRLADPPIKSLYVYHSNPATIAPDQRAVIKGLRREDLFTVVHERFLTDTARYADLVLPATTSLEHDDLYRSYGSYTAQVGRAVIPPVGEAKSNWQVFQLLARKMGWNEPFFEQSATAMIAALLAEESPWRDDQANRRLLAGEPVLLSLPGEAKKNWRTRSGKIEIANDQLTEPLPRLLSTHSAADGYPLLLQSAPGRYTLNSTFFEQERLRARQPCMQLMMHPEDARARQLRDGQAVLAKNHLGQVRFTLKLTERTPVGTVVTEGVCWREFARGDGVNALTSQRLTDGGSGSTLYDVTVEVQAVAQL